MKQYWWKFDTGNGRKNYVTHFTQKNKVVVEFKLLPTARLDTQCRYILPIYQTMSG